MMDLDLAPVEIDVSPEATRERSGRYTAAVQRYFEAKQAMCATVDRLAAQLEPPDPHVLVVDDQENVAVSVSLVLEGEDHFKVTTVTDAETALQIATCARPGQFAAALIDLHLKHPSITGLDVALALPRGVAVYLTTGEVPEELALAGERVSAVMCLEKPFSDAVLDAFRTSLRERFGVPGGRPRRDSRH